MLPNNISGDFQFKLYNQLGQLVVQREIEIDNYSPPVSFDLSAFSEGVYFFSVVSGSGEVVYSGTLVQE